MPKDEHIHVRVDEQAKSDYTQLAKNLGYDSLSAFVISVLESMRDRYIEGDWRSHLLHVSEDRIVAADAHQVEKLPLGVAAFPVVAPARFWRHVRQITSSKDESPSQLTEA